MILKEQDKKEKGMKLRKRNRQRKIKLAIKRKDERKKIPATTYKLNGLEYKVGCKLIQIKRVRYLFVVV